MRTKGLVLAVLLILASASVALAHDTAWVFWIKQSMGSHMRPDADPGETTWILERAYPNLKECEAAKQRVWELAAGHENALNPGNDPDKEPFLEQSEIPGEYIGRTWTYKDGSMQMVSLEYHCLPGTLDPREKK